MNHDPSGALMRIALGVEYDGSPFFGWQSQSGGHTVQDELQVALSSIANEPIAIIVSAQARSYRYLLINRPVRSALQSGKVGWFHTPLDVEKMRVAAQYLLGEHDFSAFRAAECQAKSPIKNLAQIAIQRQGDTIIFDLNANAFLHHMVRNIIGCLVYVGKGKHPPQWMHEVLESRSRKQAAPTFAPDGLYLHRITYDAQWGLPQVV